MDWTKKGVRLIFFLALLSFSLSSFGQEERKRTPGILSKPGHYLFFPLIVKSPEYRWGAGVGGIVYFKLKNDSAARTSSVKVVSFVTLRKQLVFANEGYFYLPGEAFIVHYIATATHFPDKFWGLGNSTLNSDVEAYTIGQFDLYPQLLREIREHLFVGVGYEFQNVYHFEYDSESGESLFDTQDIAGRNGSKISGTGMIFMWDSRSNAFSSTKGFYFQYFNNFYRTGIGSDYNFTIHSMDIRKYFGLKKSRSIAIQLVMTAATGTIPIRNMSIMGSDSYMRGYYQGRFQDRTMIATQCEFRTPVYKRFGVVMFAGLGKVGAGIHETFTTLSFKPSVGAGIRYAISKKERLNLRFDGGFGNKSYGSYLNFGEAF
jgi:hypothetical protein